MKITKSLRGLYPFLTFLVTLAVAALPVLGLVLSNPQPAVAQDAEAYGAWLNSVSDPVFTNVSADDSDVALLIVYTGTGGEGTVTVASNGDITLSVGAVGSSTVDTTVECDASIAASGSRSGIIDVSVAACDTLGEVVDAINSQTNNWRAVILDGLRSDSANDTLNALSETAATDPDGLPLYFDTSVAFLTSRALVPPSCRKMECYLDYSNGRQLTLKKNPFKGTFTTVYTWIETTTYGSGTSTVALRSVLEDNETTGGNETVTVMDSVAGGATTVAGTKTYTYGIRGFPDEKVILRVTNSAAASSVSMYGYGLYRRAAIR
jgi:hypothetical protein